MTQLDKNSVFSEVMTSCLTNGVTLTTFPYLGVCKNDFNLGCHTKLNTRKKPCHKAFPQ